MPIVVSLVINFVGCTMYGFSGALSSHDSQNGFFMLISRFLIGFGAGKLFELGPVVFASGFLAVRWSVCFVPTPVLHSPLAIRVLLGARVLPLNTSIV